ncbi:MAG: class A beta-lactamase [Acidobacteriota bacterium]
MISKNLKPLRDNLQPRKVIDSLSIPKIAQGANLVKKNSLPCIAPAVVLSFFLQLVAFAQAPTVTKSAPAGDAALLRLERELARLSKNSGGVVGATAIHIESGRRVSLNGGDRFAMASTFKVPIAVQLLARVDKGEVKLSDIITLEAKDLHPGSGTLSELFNKPGVALSVRNLLELMLLISDNSATDIILRAAGGADAVNAKLRSIGIEGISVNRSTALLISDWLGAKLPPENEWTPAMFDKLYRALTPEERKAAGKRFEADPQDTATPDGMAELLVKIHRKELHKADSAELLLDIMRRCQTGQARLKGILPADTVVAHKTGTIGGTANDVGIITLPDNAGHVAIAVFIKSSEKEMAARERVIAEIARAAHDFFLFNAR